MKAAIPCGLALGLLAHFAQGHHAFRVVYDFSRTETIEGQVVRLELVNPHARLYIEVTNQDGGNEQWLIEGPGKLALARRGWTDDMFTAGETIMVVGNPSSAGDQALWLEKIVTANGTQIVDPLLEDELLIEAERRERARRAAQ